MDIGKAFTFPFEDEDWVKKLIIGAVLMIVPIANFITIGYMLRTLRNVAEGREKPLPEWDQWGDDFMKGLLVVVAGFIYSLPIVLVSVITAILGAVLGSAESQGAQGGVALCTTVLSCLSWLWGLAVALFLPAALVKYVQEGQFGSFFKFAEIWQWIRDNIKNYIIAVLIAIVARIVALVGVIACGIGVLFTTFWATVTTGHLLGQVVAQAAPPAGPAATSYGDYTPPSPTISAGGES